MFTAEERAYIMDLFNRVPVQGLAAQVAHVNLSNKVAKELPVDPPPKSEDKPK